MSNVVEVDLWHEVYSLGDRAESLIEWFDPLLTFAKVERDKITKAKSLPKVLEYYARWLRQYHEQKCCIMIDFLRLQSISTHPRASLLIEEVELRIIELEKLASGGKPWTEISSVKRASYAAAGILNRTIDAIEDAIHRLLLLVRWRDQGKRCTA
ncbi:hypothetical protein [Brucella anthropi]|uniref:hypothetical protein n=1 Tax=Brucella anthropi TaxID=529 RepID=UPI000CFB93F6|nr:hypothetical protein [Ochrobactrum sp. MYb49]PQZ62726.1 hypothetical protein CQ057_14870 [Ochrobactrum sp. MYb49]